MSAKRWGGAQSTAARARWRPRLPLPCYRCGKPVMPTDNWHVEHMVERTLGGDLSVNNEWVSHATCNTSAGGKIGGKRAAARRKTTTRIEQRPLGW